MTTKKPAPEKRIPAGTKVQLKSPGFNSPTYQGEVVEFVPKGKKAQGSWWAETNDIYRIKVTHKNGKPVGTRNGAERIMRPYASRLEAQNPTKLRKVQG